MDLDYKDGLPGAEIAGVVIGPLIAACLLVASIQQAEKTESDVTLH